MRLRSSYWKLCISVSLILCLSKIGEIRAEETVLMSYGGHNESIGPYWVAIDKGFYQKHGLDARPLQVRNANQLNGSGVRGSAGVLTFGWQCPQRRFGRSEDRLCRFSDQGNFAGVDGAQGNRFTVVAARQDDRRPKYRRRILARDYDGAGRSRSGSGQSRYQDAGHRRGSNYCSSAAEFQHRRCRGYLAVSGGGKEGRYAVIGQLRGDAHPFSNGWNLRSERAHCQLAGPHDATHERHD